MTMRQRKRKTSALVGLATSVREAKRWLTLCRFCDTIEKSGSQDIWQEVWQGFVKEKEKQIGNVFS